MLRIKLKQEGGAAAQKNQQHKCFKEDEEEDSLRARSIPPHVFPAGLVEQQSRGVGSGNAAASAKLNIMGHPVRRRNGEKVHICLRCNFPIAIYGRLDPCDHIFCLTCAEKNPNCFLCDEKISRVRKLEMLDGVYICGASRCLKSFLDNTDFELHVKNAHKELLLGMGTNQQQTSTTPQVDSARPQLNHGSTPPPFERQSRQQQFRNAQQQRQLQQQQEHQQHALKPKAHNKGSASLPHPYPHPHSFAFSAYSDYTTQDAHNFYANPDVFRFQNASPSQPPGFV